MFEIWAYTGIFIIKTGLRNTVHDCYLKPYITCCEIFIIPVCFHSNLSTVHLALAVSESQLLQSGILALKLSECVPVDL